MQTIKKIWYFLEGNKRRIALVGSFVASISPSYTLANQIGQGVFLLFASADMLQLTTRQINKFKEGKTK